MTTKEAVLTVFMESETRISDQKMTRLVNELIEETVSHDDILKILNAEKRKKTLNFTFKDHEYFKIENYNGLIKVKEITKKVEVKEKKEKKETDQLNLF